MCFISRFNITQNRCLHTINYVPSASTVLITRILCHQLTAKGEKCMYVTTHWIKRPGPGCWNPTCSMQRRPGVPPEPDTIKILSVSGWDLFFATAFSAFGGVQSGPLLAQKLFCKAGPRVTVHTPRVGHAHTQTHRQSEMEAPAKSITTPSWGQQWNQEAHLAYFGQLLQNFSSPSVTLGTAGNYRETGQEEGTPCSPAEK